MPVTLRPWAASSLQANCIRGFKFAQSPVDLLARATPGNGEGSKPYVPNASAILQSSHSDINLTTPIQPHRNGLFGAVTDAYSAHHHLNIRPEDVWFSILTQFSAYVNAHAEDLRSQFVAHEGKMELTLEYAAGSRFNFDWSRLPRDMGDLLEANVVDPELRTWIFPDFSTTTVSDKVIASVMMMGALQAYFSYTVMLTCGLPSVTLLGEKPDWEVILKRLDKLDEYGPEPVLFASLLRPIVQRFIRSFEEPESPEIIDFWHNVAAHQGGSGMDYFNGWITAFCFWDNDGKQMYDLSNWKAKGKVVLDGMKYGAIDEDDVPAAWVKVPININDNGEEVKAEMVAGTLGIECSRNPWNEFTADGTLGVDTMQPWSGWWIYEKPEGS